MRTALSVLEYADERYERMIEIIEAPSGQPGGPEDPRSDVAAAWRCEARAILDDLDSALEETSVRLAVAEREGRAWAVHIWLAWRGRLLFQPAASTMAVPTWTPPWRWPTSAAANVANAAGLLTPRPDRAAHR